MSYNTRCMNVKYQICIMYIRPKKLHNNDQLPGKISIQHLITSCMYFFYLYQAMLRIQFGSSFQSTFYRFNNFNFFLKIVVKFSQQGHY